MRGWDDRARITLPNVVLWLAALAFLGALAPVFYSSLESAVGETSTGALLLYRLLPSLAVLILITVIWRKATAGVS
jgi:hypothetical protein